MIITKTPFRMSFFGGGTDMENFFRENGGAVLSTTFDKYCYVNVRHLPRFFDYSTEISYSKTERVTDIDMIQHPAIRNAMKMLDMHEIRLTYEADLPARSGLGTSSSFAVGMLNAFYALKGKYADKKKLADEAIYLERELCKEGFLTDIKKLELIDGAAEAIKKINESGYLAIVVTNQPVIARGEVSFEELESIHNKMETLLGEKGAYINGIYFCPHHPDKGFAGERIEYKINCECRKPKPGMLLQAAGDFNIDLSSSWMVGDGRNDIEAGKSAGCKTILIGNEEFGQSVSVNSLKEFVDRYLE